MAGDAVSALGAFNQGKADEIAGNYNAAAAEQNATYTIEKAREDERRQRVVSKKFIGDIRAGYGASGITTDGSALDVLEESAGNAELDALTIRHEGALRAAAYRSDANYERAAGKNARKSGDLKAAGYLLKSGEKGVSMAGGGA